MGTKTKKGTRGAAVEYYSKKQAMRHLQISLPSFIRLCLWKGIYPSEPHSRKTVGKGSTTPKVYYKRKDINLLLSDPLIHTLREIRINNLKIRNARERGDKDRIYRLMKNKPRYTLDRLVYERYPNIKISLQEIGDALRSVFVFSTLPKMTQFNAAIVPKCRSLRLQWLHLVVAKRAVRRVFIGTRSITFEVVLMDTAVRFCLPHSHTATVLPGAADYRLLSNQVEFDVCMVGTALKGLYRAFEMVYPPPETSIEVEGLARTDLVEGPQQAISDRLAQLGDIDEQAVKEAVKIEREDRVKGLFDGKNVLLGREVPLEPLVILVRACGGNVSWEETVCRGAPSLDRVDIMVVDRPMDGDKMDPAIVYVQPQYIFDSVNGARLLPVKDYLPGASLPAHVSPFLDASGGDYEPPEARYILGEEEPLQEEEETEVGAPEEAAYESEDEDGSEEEDDDYEEEEEEAVQEKQPAQERLSKDQLKAKIEANKQTRLLEMELPKKRRNLYNKMKHAEEKKVKDVRRLQQKRKAADDDRKKAKVAKK